MSEKEKIELSEEQEEVFQNIKKFINGDDNDYCLLEGSAGSGKTTLVSFIIRELLDTSLFGNICIAGTTHKCVKVLKAMCDPEIASKIGFSTVHSLLGMKCKITKEGKEVFERDRQSISKVPLYDFIIIDEVSMLADELFNELHDQNYKHIKVLFVGDSNQINPINHTHSIPMLEEKRKLFDIAHFKLTKVIRQAENNPIIKFSRRVLNDEFSLEGGLKDIVDNTGIVMLGDQKEVLEGLLKYYFCSDKFDENADYCRLIAWRNATVERFNHTIRRMKYGSKAGKVVMNEKLIVDRPIKGEGVDNQTVLFHTNEDLIVRDIKETTKKLWDTEFKIYRTFVQGDTEQEYIDIIHERYEGLYAQMLKKMADDANSERDNFQRVSKWKKYFSFIDSFANVKYGYGITAHTSQGSTYDNAFVFYSDIMANRKEEERKRIIYTSMTRPKNMLFMF
jgi:nucleoside-triphosphatase THEP1